MKDTRTPARKILVLEEDSAYGRTITREAKALKLDMDICVECDEFTRKAREAHYDFALINFDLELFRNEHVTQTLKNLPVVVMSRDALVQTQQVHWPQSIAGFISKSVSPKEVLEAALSLVDQAAPAGSGRPLNYLLIDDDVSFGKIMEKLAEKSAISITHVTSLGELRKNRHLDGFDAVLLDYDLETTTGFAVAEVLNTTARDKPIIMISATNRPGQDRLGRMPNIIGFVSKWGSPREFLDATFTMFRGKTAAEAKGS